MEGVKDNVIADTTFYICFLDDINKPEYLIRIIRLFKFVLGSKIKEELEQSLNYKFIKDLIGNQIEFFEYFNYGEILKPFFSSREIKKGEHEAIVIAIILHRIQKLSIILIIDEKSARNFVKKNFPDIFERMKYTVKFIKECYCNYKIFNKIEVLDILRRIKSSNFRINKEILENVINDIENGEC